MKGKKLLITCLSVLFCVVTSSGQCIDMTSLSSSQITCMYGTFYNPYAYTGVAYNRHTLNTNPNAMDPIAKQLRVVPVGEKTSIRLGNSRVGAQAEAINFRYTVPADNPILLLKYAAVMENPGHPASDQPRLTLQVSDASGRLIDPDCTSFDFVSSASLGWNTIQNSSYSWYWYEYILWKDWTCIGVDLSAYIGQTVNAKLTNYDCEQMGHYGYAYIHLSCAPKKISVTSCGSSATTLSAPTGFAYRWYAKSGGQTTELGRRQSIDVKIDGKEYFCDVSQPGKPSCYYTLSVVAEPRLPLAKFSVRQVKACTDTLYLTNLSGVSRDGL